MTTVLATWMSWVIPKELFYQSDGDGRMSCLGSGESEERGWTEAINMKLLSGFCW